MPSTGSRRRQFRDEDWDEVASAYRRMRRQRRPKRLYRDKENGFFGGVCAGIANYFGVEAWIVRLLTVTLAIFTSFLLVLIAYVVLVIVIDPKPKYEDEWDDFVDEEEQLSESLSSLHASPKLALRVASADLRSVELRLRRLETYVTSPKYNLDRGFHEMG